MSTNEAIKKPVPPFSREEAEQKVRMAEDAWNSRAPEKVALAYTENKELWCHVGNRIAVRFAYEWHDNNHNWFRAYGNENWQFSSAGLMEYRHASINDLAISEDERLFYWPQGRRPDDHAGLSELGL